MKFIFLYPSNIFLGEKRLKIKSLEKFSERFDKKQKNYYNYFCMRLLNGFEFLDFTNFHFPLLLSLNLITKKIKNELNLTRIKKIKGGNEYA